MAAPAHQQQDPPIARILHTHLHALQVSKAMRAAQAEQAALPAITILATYTHGVPLQCRQAWQHAFGNQCTRIQMLRGRPPWQAAAGPSSRC